MKAMLFIKGAILALAVASPAAAWPYPTDKPARSVITYYDTWLGSEVGVQVTYCDGTHFFDGQLTLYSEQELFECE